MKGLESEACHKAVEQRSACTRTKLGVTGVLLERRVRRLYVAANRETDHVSWVDVERAAKSRAELLEARKPWRVFPSEPSWCGPLKAVRVLRRALLQEVEAVLRAVTDDSRVSRRVVVALQADAVYRFAELGKTLRTGDLLWHELVAEDVVAQSHIE